MSKIIINTPDSVGPAAGEKTESPRWREFRRKVRSLSKNPGAVVGAVLVGIFLFTALLAPILAPYDYTEQSLLDRLMPPGPGHVLGTDEYGRDILSRIIIGSRVSLGIGVVSVLVAASIGVLLGLLAGYYPRLDNPIMRLSDILLAFPGVLLALAVVAALGPGLYNVMIAMGIWAVPVYTRVTRASVLSVKASQFIEAAHAIGNRDTRIILKHVLPNIMTPILIISTMRIGSAILSAAGLSFLGLGAQPPTPDWGAMLNAGKAYLRDAYWVALFPGIAISLTVLGFNLLGDGLRDVLDPRLKD